MWLNGTFAHVLTQYASPSHLRTIPAPEGISDTVLQRRNLLVQSILDQRASSSVVRALMLGDFALELPCLRTARILGRAHGDAFLNATQVFQDARSPHLPNTTGSVSALISDGGTGMVVFPYLPAGVHAPGAPNVRMYVPYVNFDSGMWLVLERIFDDLRDSNRSRAWLGQTGVTRIRRRERLTIDRFITRYTHLAQSMTSAQIRNLSEHIRSESLPPVLRWVESERDAMIMYASGPTSCMTERVDHGMRNYSWMFKQDTHPTAFFHYHPSVQGVFLARGDRVLARTFVYGTGDNRTCGRIYAVNDTNLMQFTTALREAGVDIGSSFRYNQSVQFEVPGIPLPDSTLDFALPIPYFDNLSGSVYIRFRKEANVFDVVCGAQSGRIPEGFLPVDGGSTRGFVLASEIVTQQCAHCNSTIHPRNGRYTHQSNGEVFCSTHCVTRHGHVLALRSDGMSVVVDRDQAIPDAIDSTLFFTNLEAALANGATPVRLTTVENGENEEAISASGHIVHDESGNNIGRVRQLEEDQRNLRGNPRITPSDRRLIATNANCIGAVNVQRNHVQIHNYELCKETHVPDWDSLDGVIRDLFTPEFGSAVRVIGPVSSETCNRPFYIIQEQGDTQHAVAV